MAKQRRHTDVHKSPAQKEQAIPLTPKPLPVEEGVEFAVGPDASSADEPLGKPMAKTVVARDPAAGFGNIPNLSLDEPEPASAELAEVADEPLLAEPVAEEPLVLEAEPASDVLTADVVEPSPEPSSVEAALLTDDEVAAADDVMSAELVEPVDASSVELTDADLAEAVPLTAEPVSAVLAADVIEPLGDSGASSGEGELVAEMLPDSGVEASDVVAAEEVPLSQHSSSVFAAEFAEAMPGGSSAIVEAEASALDEPLAAAAHDSAVLIQPVTDEEALSGPDPIQGQPPSDVFTGEFFQENEAGSASKKESSGIFSDVAVPAAEAKEDGVIAAEPASAVAQMVDAEEDSVLDDAMPIEGEPVSAIAAAEEPSIEASIVDDASAAQPASAVAELEDLEEPAAALAEEAPSAAIFAAEEPSVEEPPMVEAASFDSEVLAGQPASDVFEADSLEEEPIAAEEPSVEAAPVVDAASVDPDVLTGQPTSDVAIADSLEDEPIAAIAAEEPSVEAEVVTGQPASDVAKADRLEEEPIAAIADEEPSVEAEVLTGQPASDVAKADSLEDEPIAAIAAEEPSAEAEVLTGQPASDVAEADSLEEEPIAAIADEEPSAEAEVLTGQPASDVAKADSLEEEPIAAIADEEPSVEAEVLAGQPASDVAEADSLEEEPIAAIADEEPSVDPGVVAGQPATAVAEADSLEAAIADEEPSVEAEIVAEADSLEEEPSVEAASVVDAASVDPGVVAGQPASAVAEADSLEEEPIAAIADEEPSVEAEVLAEQPASDAAKADILEEEPIAAIADEEPSVEAEVLAGQPASAVAKADILEEEPIAAVADEEPSLDEEPIAAAAPILEDEQPLTGEPASAIAAADVSSEQGVLAGDEVIAGEAASAVAQVADAMGADAALVADSAVTVKPVDETGSTVVPEELGLDAALFPNDSIAPAPESAVAAAEVGLDAALFPDETPAALAPAEAAADSGLFPEAPIMDAAEHPSSAVFGNETPLAGEPASAIAALEEDVSAEALHDEPAAAGEPASAVAVLEDDLADSALHDEPLAGAEPASAIAVLEDDLADSALHGEPALTGAPSSAVASLDDDVSESALHEDALITGESSAVAALAEDALDDEAVVAAAEPVSAVAALADDLATDALDEEPSTADAEVAEPTSDVAAALDDEEPASAEPASAIAAAEAAAVLEDEEPVSAEPASALALLDDDAAVGVLDDDEVAAAEPVSAVAEAEAGSAIAALEDPVETADVLAEEEPVAGEPASAIQGLTGYDLFDEEPLAAVAEAEPASAIAEADSGILADEEPIAAEPGSAIMMLEDDVAAEPASAVVETDGIQWDDAALALGKKDGRLATDETIGLDPDAVVARDEPADATEAMDTIDFFADVPPPVKEKKKKGKKKGKSVVDQWAEGEMVEAEAAPPSSRTRRMEAAAEFGELPAEVAEAEVEEAEIAVADEDIAIEAAVEEEPIEAAVEEDAIEAAVEEDIAEAAVEEDAIEAAVEEDVAEAAVDEEPIEAAVEEEIAEADVEEEAVEAGVEDEIAEADVAEEAVEAGVEEEIAEADEDIIAGAAIEEEIAEADEDVTAAAEVEDDIAEADEDIIAEAEVEDEIAEAEEDLIAEAEVEDDIAVVTEMEETALPGGKRGKPTMFAEPPAPPRRGKATMQFEEPRLMRGGKPTRTFPEDEIIGAEGDMIEPSLDLHPGKLAGPPPPGFEKMSLEIEEEIVDAEPEFAPLDLEIAEAEVEVEVVEALEEPAVPGKLGKQTPATEDWPRPKTLLAPADWPAAKTRGQPGLQMPGGPAVAKGGRINVAEHDGEILITEELGDDGAMLVTEELGDDGAMLITEELGDDGAMLITEELGDDGAMLITEELGDDGAMLITEELDDGSMVVMEELDDDGAMLITEELDDGGAMVVTEELYEGDGDLLVTEPIHADDDMVVSEVYDDSELVVTEDMGDEEFHGGSGLVVVSEAVDDFVRPSGKDWARAGSDDFVRQPQPQPKPKYGRRWVGGVLLGWMLLAGAAVGVWFFKPDLIDDAYAQIGDKKKQLLPGEFAIPKPKADELRDSLVKDEFRKEPFDPKDNPTDFADALLDVFKKRQDALKDLNDADKKYDLATLDKRLSDLAQQQKALADLHKKISDVAKDEKKLADILKNDGAGAVVQGLFDKFKEVDGKLAKLNETLKDADVKGEGLEGLAALIKARDDLKDEHGKLDKVVSEALKELIAARVLEPGAKNVVKGIQDIRAKSENPIGKSLSELVSSMSGLGPTAATYLDKYLDTLETRTRLKFYEEREKYFFKPADKMDVYLVLFKERGPKDPADMRIAENHAKWLLEPESESSAEVKAKAHFLKGLILRHEAEALSDANNPKEARGKFKEAREAMQAALDIDIVKKDDDAKTAQKARALVAEFKAAEKELTNPMAYFMPRVKTLVEQGQVRSAKQVLDRALNAIVDNPILLARNSLFRLEVERAKFISEEDRKTPEFRKTFESIRDEAKRAADKVGDKAADKDTKEAKSWATFVQGVCEEELGDLYQATKLYRDALEMHPAKEEVPPSDLVGRIHIALGRVLLRERTPAGKAVPLSSLDVRPPSPKMRYSELWGSSQNSADEPSAPNYHPLTALVAAAVITQPKFDDDEDPAKTKRIKESLDLAEKLINPENPKAIQGQGYMIKGLAKAEQGFATDGLKLYAKGLEMVFPDKKSQDLVRELNKLMEDNPIFERPDATTRPNKSLADRHYARGRQLYFDRQYEEAEKHFKQAVTYWDKYSPYMYYLGLSQLAQNTRAKRAAADFNLRQAGRLETKGGGFGSFEEVNESLERVQGELRQYLNKYRMAGIDSPP